MSSATFQWSQVPIISQINTLVNWIGGKSESSGGTIFNSTSSATDSFDFSGTLKRSQEIAEEYKQAYTSFDTNVLQLAKDDKTVENIVSTLSRSSLPKDTSDVLAYVNFLFNNNAEYGKALKAALQPSGNSDEALTIINQLISELGNINNKPALEATLKNMGFVIDGSGGIEGVTTDSLSQVKNGLLTNLDDLSYPSRLKHFLKSSSIDYRFAGHLTNATDQIAKLTANTSIGTYSAKTTLMHWVLGGIDSLTGNQGNPVSNFIRNNFLEGSQHLDAKAALAKITVDNSKAIQNASGVLGKTMQVLKNLGKTGDVIEAAKPLRAIPFLGAIFNGNLWKSLLGSINIFQPGEIPGHFGNLTYEVGKEFGMEAGTMWLLAAMGGPVGWAGIAASLGLGLLFETPVRLAMDGIGNFIKSKFGFGNGGNGNMLANTGNMMGNAMQQMPQMSFDQALNAAESLGIDIPEGLSSLGGGSSSSTLSA
ncbi:MAG TPA: hypothetical protein V6C96_03160 [Vampirovibrionales bacterium]